MRTINNWAIGLLTCLIITAGQVYADFTFGTMPDTQNISETDAKGEWIHKMALFYTDRKYDLNIRFVASLGDMVQNKTVDAEWVRVKTAYDEFADAMIPFNPCEGNHDNVNSLNKWFPESEFQSDPFYGYVGKKDGMENSYYTFSADGMDFIVVVTEYQPTEADLTWASGIFSAHPNHRGIYVTHFAFEAEQRMANENDNVFLIVFGHDTGWDRGERYYTQSSTGGNTQHFCMSDYQGRSEAADGAIDWFTSATPRVLAIKKTGFFGAQ